MKSLYTFLVIFIFLLTQKAISECDPGRPVRTITFTYRGCPVEVTYCCDLVFDLHNVSILSIKVLLPCDTTIYESNKEDFTDSMMKEIAIDGRLVPTPDSSGCWDTIPPCEVGELCIVRWKDEICYEKWEYYPGNPPAPPYWGMITCDSYARCNETI